LVARPPVAFVLSSSLISLHHDKLTADWLNYYYCCCCCCYYYYYYYYYFTAGLVIED